MITLVASPGATGTSSWPCAPPSRGTGDGRRRASFDNLRAEGLRAVDCEHFFDGYRASPEYAKAVVRAAAEVGADVVVLCDTNGGMLPAQIQAVVATVLADGARLGIHAQDDHRLRGRRELDRLEFHPAEPGADDAMRADYTHALDAYEQAKTYMAEARRPEDVRAVTQALEDGRFSLARLAARRSGEPLPERRPPHCFFDPRHGPSVADVTWTPPGGATRQVPVCAADRARLDDGLGPMIREVDTDYGRRPYWDAGPAYGPWAGGYFGGGILPGLLMGTVLGRHDRRPRLRCRIRSRVRRFGGGFEGGDVSGADFDPGDFGGGFGGGDFGGGGGGNDSGGGF
ncbi:hypothetical protein SFUMM280S_06448 [Streptomyces fumanus]